MSGINSGGTTSGKCSEMLDLGIRVSGGVGSNAIILVR